MNKRKKWKQLTAHWPWHRKLRVWLRTMAMLTQMWCVDIAVALMLYVGLMWFSLREWCRRNLPWCGR